MAGTSGGRQAAEDARLEPPHEVFACFGISDVRQVTAIAEGLMNRNWRVATRSASFVLKEVQDVDAEQAEFQHGVTAGLAARGLPVPAPLPTRVGGTLARVGDRLYSCFRWIEGDHRTGLDLSSADCAALGGLLAQLHLALAEVAPPPASTSAQPVVEAATVKDRIDRYLGLVEARSKPDAFDRLVSARLTERRELLERWAWLRPEESAGYGPTGWVHGDFHNLNLLFGADGVAAVIDWDRLKVWPYATELVRSATLLFGYGDGRGLDLQRVAAFSTGYRRENALPVDAVAAAVHWLWWERLADFWQLSWHYERGDSGCDHLFVSASALLSWWTDHRDEVTATFTRPIPSTG